MKEIRMLAAIMFTDIVGYTAIMQENEKLAKTLRERHREVLEKCTLEHRGQILQYYGDGTLTIFGSAIESVICAAEIQQEFQKVPKVPLRIGIHSGDIVYDDDGIYGDGVNVASRIESIALPGSVLISSKINDELLNQKGVSAKFIGRFHLKNVKDPVKIYAVSSHGLVVPSHDQLEGKITTSENSIAVLPFINMSIDKNNEYFSDGMTEEILNALAKVDGLMVTSRTSSFAFKGKQTDIREIGKLLGVKSVLEGSVRKYGNKVRVTAQLINTDDGYHRWSNTYDRDLEDIFVVQDELANAIVDQLKNSFSLRKPSESLVKIPTENMEAYNLYLKGLYYWNKWNPSDVHRAIKLFEDALKITPGFSLVYSRLSACYVYLGAIGHLLNKTAYPKAREYALKSIALDDSLVDSHLSLGMVKYFNDWDWAGSKKCFKKALEINPNSAEAHQYYAMLLSTLGHFKKALKEAETAYKLDPLNGPINYILSFAYLNVNQLDNALSQTLKLKEIDPDFGDAWSSLVWLYVKQGQYKKAIEIFSREFTNPAFKAKAVSGRGYLHAKLSEIDEARAIVKQLEEMNSDDRPLDMELAMVYVGLNEMDTAFKYLNSACDKKLGGMNFIKCRYWKEIQDDPRFNDLLIKMNLPEV